MSVRTQVNGENVFDVPVEDPFHTTLVRHNYSLWEWFMLLFRGRKIVVVVKIVADGCAIGRWFQGADICEKCCRARITGNASSPGYESHGMNVCEDCYYDNWDNEAEAVGKIVTLAATDK